MAARKKKLKEVTDMEFTNQEDGTVIIVFNKQLFINFDKMADSFVKFRKKMFPEKSEIDLEKRRSTAIKTKTRVKE